MQAFFGKLGQVLSGRVARNVYLWIVIGYMSFNMNTNSRVYPDAVYHRYIAITTILLFALTYINNLVLVPKILARKKYFLYFLLAGATTYLFSFVYTVVLKLAIQQYPLLKIHQVSLITSPVGTKWDIAEIIDEMGTYAFGLGMWVLILIMAWYMNDYARQRKLAETAKRKQVELELNFLKGQINPHFLFNTLNNLYGLALKKSDNTPDTILKLSSILRYLLYESNAEKMSVEKEKEIMQAYIDLELLRLKDHSGLSFHISTDKNYTIPPLLWLPVLENTFKHATRVIADSYLIEYSFEIKDNSLQIRARNNYKSAVSNTDAGGIGLENMYKRLALLYPGKHQVDIQKDEEFYNITVAIDLV